MKSTDLPLKVPVIWIFGIFFICQHEQAVEQTSELPVIWDGLNMINLKLSFKQFS